MAKRRPLKDPKESSDAKQPWPPTQFAQQALSPSNSNNNNSNSADDLERQISNILTTIPAHIRLTSGPEADASEIKHPRAASSLGNTRSHPGNSLRASRAAGGIKSPELTLSPVKHDSEASSYAGGSSRRGGADDIKLYHLTQPGKDKPIKLFVRRVGENGERVMVRVGGGWADLGEYLRQYAEHHGRRTVSEGKFEVLGLEPPGSTTATATATAGATSAAARTATGDASVRPGSAASKKDFRFAAGTPVGGRPATPSVTPGKASALDAAQLTPSITTTPAAAAAAAGESGSSTGSSGRVSWSGNEVGLAGPKAKKLDLSGEKLEWIEGMMNQARRVSGHVNASSTGVAGGGGAKGEVEGASRLGVGGGGAGAGTGGVKGDFGDLGKVGGTMRLFLKSPANSGD
jgi:Growth-Arrest-Specific Protein 2 Domain